MASELHSQINVLCVGDVLCGKSTFLQFYTQCMPENLHYKVYPKMHQKQSIIYFHEVKERFGMQAYFSYPFDAILYFLNINDYHNPQYSIIQQLTQISKLNGTNIFKMPLKVLVLSSKTHHFSDISQAEKSNLKKQLLGMVKESMIIFVENDESYSKELSRFYQQIKNGDAEGISESFYVNWQLKGFQGLIPVQNMLFTFKKIYQNLRKQYQKLHFLNLMLAKQKLHYKHK